MDFSSNRTCSSASNAVSQLARTLSNLIAGRPCVLLDWPSHANVGDHLIWLGQKVIFKDFIGADIIYQSSYSDVDLSKLKRDNLVILCHGGGNFGDLYPHHQKFREDIANAYPENTIIFLPQSIFYNSEENQSASHRALATHKNITLFTRDAQSYAVGRSLLDCSNILLGIDSAFALQPYFPRLLGYFSAARTKPLYLVRRDRESTVGFDRIPKDATVIDWVDEARIRDVLSDMKCESAIMSNGLGHLIDDYRDLESLRYFLRAVKLFSQASVVVTDRLHAHILALLMGIPCELYDNTYKKNSRFTDIWTRDDSLLKLCC
jgi:pyruvyl transferase EpsO